MSAVVTLNLGVEGVDQGATLPGRTRHIKGYTAYTGVFRVNKKGSPAHRPPTGLDVQISRGPPYTHQKDSTYECLGQFAERWHHRCAHIMAMMAWIARHPVGAGLGPWSGSKLVGDQGGCPHECSQGRRCLVGRPAEWHCQSGKTMVGQ